MRMNPETFKALVDLIEIGDVEVETDIDGQFVIYSGLKKTRSDETGEYDYVEMEDWDFHGNEETY